MVSFSLETVRKLPDEPARNPLAMDWTIQWKRGPKFKIGHRVCMEGGRMKVFGQIKKITGMGKGWVTMAVQEDGSNTRHIIFTKPEEVTLPVWQRILKRIPFYFRS